MIYIIFFIMAIILLHMSVKMPDKKKAAFLYLFSGGILVLLAALRSDTVGIDVSVYMKRFFGMAMDAPDLFTYMKSVKNEHLYMLVTYLAAKLTGNIQFVFFLNELIIITFVYLTIWENREDIYCEAALLLFLAVFYGQTFNTVRQNMAMAIVLYAFSKLRKGRRGLFYILLVIAAGFHISAIAAVTLDLLYTIGKLDIAKKLRWIFITLVVVTTVWYLQVFKFLCSIMTFLPERYATDKYLYREYNISSCGLGLWGIMFAAALIYLLRKKEDAEFWFYIQTLCLAGVFVAARALFVNRIYWYFEYISILFISKKDFLPMHENIKIRRLGYGMLTAVMILYFLIIELYLNAAGINPYIFFWNG